jgi:hypothetical protein
MKTEVYSWRLSADLKSELEQVARMRKVPVSSILESAVRDLLRQNPGCQSEEETQFRLQQSASACLGVLASGKRRRAETARSTLRQKLRQRSER